MTRTRKIVGWIYADDELKWESLSAWSDSPKGMYICLLKNKNGAGKFAVRRVRVTIEELGGTKKGNP